MWEKFIDKWLGPNMFGGYLAQTGANKARAVRNCAFHYSAWALFIFCVLLSGLGQ